MKRVVISIIRAYQNIQKVLQHQSLPLLFSAGCRSWPTCSQFSIEAVERYGVIKGLWKGFIRVLRCNPFFEPIKN